MKLLRTTLVLLCAAAELAGCSSLKKLTGQRDDTVLPGAREDILPPDQQVNPKPGNKAVLGGEPARCDPAVDATCTEGNVDQEAPGNS